MKLPPRLRLAATLALGLAACKSQAERASDRIMPAVEAFVATVPPTDPKEFVRTAPGYADTLKQLEGKLQGELHPPPGTPAAAKLATPARWVEMARAEHKALEAAFAQAIGPIEFESGQELGAAVAGGPAKPAEEIASALAQSSIQPIVLWHGRGPEGGFDEDYQHLGARRAVDPGERFIVGHVQRVGGEGVTFAPEKVTAERKVAFVTFHVMPSKRRLGTFKVLGETAKLPTPVPLPGTVIPGAKPPLVESLLGKL